MITYRRSCEIAAPIEAVFAHCTRVEGFAQQFPFAVRWLDGPDRWGEGAHLAFRYRVAGVWVPHEARVTSFDAGRSFVDEMTRGLYRAFRHTHRFEPVAGGTRVTDIVEFSLGLGSWIDRTIGRWTLARTFRLRHRALARWFAGGHDAR